MKRLALLKSSLIVEYDCCYYDFNPGMIFGLGAASIFYITTGQCFFDLKATFGNICCSGNNTDRVVNSDERSLLLEEGDPTSVSKLYGT